MAFRFYSGPDYLALPREPQPWVIKKLVPVGGLTNVYGKPKSCKSFAALGMALAVANNEPDWQGFEVRLHGKVAYLQVDTPREEWAGRLVKLRDNGFDLRNIFTADMNIVPYPFDIKHDSIAKELHGALADFKPILMVIDTLRESFSGNENDSDIMRTVISNFVASCRFSDSDHLRRAAIILVSHARKDGVLQQSGVIDDDIMEGNRGSNYVPGRMDTIIKMTPQTEKHPGTFSYKGRGTRFATLKFEQDGFGNEDDPKSTGLVYLAGSKEKFEWQKQARTILADPNIPFDQKSSIRKVAELIDPERFETVRKEIGVVFKQSEAGSAAVY